LTFYDNYNVLKHNGGNGPYSDRESYGIDRNPPAGCAVDQVIMCARHGERYPDPSVGKNMEGSLAKVYASNTTFTGDLAFLNDWTYFVPEPLITRRRLSQAPMLACCSDTPLEPSIEHDMATFGTANTSFPYFPVDMRESLKRLESLERASTDTITPVSWPSTLSPRTRLKAQTA